MFREVIHEERLGYGRHSTVLATTDARVACKKVEFKEQDLSVSIVREIAALSALRNVPNVVQLYAVNLRPLEAYIFMRRYNGSLRDAKPKQSTISIMIKICRALEAAKKRGIYHQDLKPDNILLSDDDVAICDWGLSCRENKGNLGLGPTLMYRAPELLHRESFSTTNLENCDVWSLGCLFSEMFSGKILFFDGTDKYLLENKFDQLQLIHNTIQTKTRFKSIPKEFRDLLREMLSLNPECRPSFQECVHKLEAIQTSSPLIPKNIISKTTTVTEGAQMETDETTSMFCRKTWILNIEQRRTVCDWLLRCTVEMQFPLFMFFLIMEFVDAMIEKGGALNLQLYGYAAFLLVSKIHSSCNVNLFNTMCDKSFRTEIAAAEREMFSVIYASLHRKTEYDILRENCCRTRAVIWFYLGTLEGVMSRAFVNKLIDWAETGVPTPVEFQAFAQKLLLPEKYFNTIQTHLLKTPKILQPLLKIPRQWYL